MRLAFALIPALLVAAQVASAAEPSSGQGAPANGQPAQSVQDAQRHGAQDPRGAQESVVVMPRLTHADYPAFGNEKDEANCYYVFGELKCERLHTSNAAGGPK